MDSSFDQVLKPARNLAPYNLGRDALRRRPHSAETIYLSFLLFSCFLDLWTPGIGVGNLNLRPSEILVLPGVFFLIRRYKRQGVRGLWPPYAMAAMALCFFFLAWTLINSRQPTLGLAHGVLLVLNVLHYWVFAILASTDWQRFYRMLRWTAAGIALMGFWMAVSYFLGARGLLHVGSMEGMALGSSLAGGSVYRLDYGVLAGCIGSWAAIVSLGCLLNELRPRWLMVLGIALGGLVMVLGLSRGAIVTLALGLAINTYLLARQGRLRLVLAGAILSMLALTLIFWTLLTFFPATTIVQTFIGRFSLLLHRTAYDTGTVEARLQSWRLMLADVRRNPFWGQGGDSYHIYFPPQIHDSENFSLEILHATGVWGFSAFVILVGGVMLRAYRMLFAKGLTLPQRGVSTSLLAAFTGLLAASQTNPIGWSSLFWLALGLVAAATRLPGTFPPAKVRRKKRRTFTTVAPMRMGDTRLDPQN